MPHLDLLHISDKTMLTLVVVVLVGGLALDLVSAIVGTVRVLIFGDRSKSPLDRWATWLAKNWENDEGGPIVKPGKEPTPEQKFAAVALFLAFWALIGWLILR